MLPIGIVCAAFILIGAGVSLSGEFPVNDDYIYTWSVKHLLDTGHFKIPGTVASSIFPIYSGAAACLLTGGFSYTVLRSVSFVFGVVGAIGLYCTLREIRLNSKAAALFTAVYLLNPLFVNVCFGFMTDVPALALNNWLLFFGLKLAKHKRTEPSTDKEPQSWWALGGAAIVLTLAVASRQTVLAFLPCLLLLTAKKRSGWMFRLSILALLAVWPVLFYKLLEPIVLGACDYLTSYTGYKQFVADNLQTLVKDPVAGLTMFGEQAVKVLCYLGLFCIPLTGPLIFSTLTRTRTVLKYWVLALLAGCITLVYPLWSLVGAKQLHMPFSENLFAPPAVGTYCILSGGVPGWSLASKNALTAYAVICAATALSLVLVPLLLPFREVRGKCQRWLAAVISRVKLAHCFVFAAWACAAGSLVIQTSVMNLDRYYLLALAPIILVFGLLWRKVRAQRMFGLGVILCVIMFGYSFATAYDCMSFQRERWNALNWLLQQGAKPLEIDGGPEFNYRYNMALCEGYRMDKEYFGWPDKYRGGQPRCQWRWWPISGEKYIVCGSRLDGYRVMKTFPYFSPLKGRKRDIFVLKANEVLSD